MQHPDPCETKRSISGASISFMVNILIVRAHTLEYAEYESEDQGPSPRDPQQRKLLLLLLLLLMMMMMMMMVMMVMMMMQ